ncbi:MAG: hypothetical protein AVDCRST_MAG45-499 [uncultured Solirubrobacterales bacterium]|uniref:Inhibitor I9 domain-containing protein n=1 Tax=uncultured Solirubrobacterales bacterium TaxID=768556 RepID=A0A6J4S9Q0_9ACTN|nr:MAG: hypothetical protein AVDCRST_MAG45-499 [uncultured Solirubrobacterales bacterium]
MRRLLSFALLALLGAVGLIALASESGSPKQKVAVAERSNGARDERADAAEVPGQYIVTFNRAAESPGAETESRERRQGFKAEYVYNRAVEGFSAELSPQQVDRLEADPEVAAVTPDRKVRAVAGLASGEPTPPGGHQAHRSRHRRERSLG